MDLSEFTNQLAQAAAKREQQQREKLQRACGKATGDTKPHQKASTEKDDARCVVGHGDAVTIVPTNPSIVSSSEHNHHHALGNFLVGSSVFPSSGSVWRGGHGKGPEVLPSMSCDVEQQPVGTVTSTRAETLLPCRRSSRVFPGRPPGPSPNSTTHRQPSIFCDSFVSPFPGVPPGPCPATLKTLTVINPRHTVGGTEMLQTRVPPVSSKTASSRKVLPPLPVPKTPPDGLSSRKLLWQTVPDARSIGSIWETLLKEDSDLPRSTYKETASDQAPPPTHGMVPGTRRRTVDYEGSRLSACTPQPYYPILETPISSFFRSRTERSERTTTNSSRLSDDTSRNTATVELTRLEPDYGMLNDLFFENVDARKKAIDPLLTQTTLLSGSPPTVEILDAKRRQNLEICLKGIGLLESLKPLLNTVVELTPFTERDVHDPVEKHCLSSENLQMLISLYPTAEEEKLLREQLAKTPLPTLARVETFLVQLLKINFFKSKAECCLIHLTFNDEARACHDKAYKLNRCLSRVMKSLNDGCLRSLLALTLKIGNYLNHGSKKGSARGFLLESLPLLKTTKSIDGSTNVLRCIADTIETENPKYWKDLGDALGGCSTGNDISYEDIVTLVNQLAAKIDKVEKQVQQIGSSAEWNGTRSGTGTNAFHSEQTFVNVFAQFIQSSRSKLQSTQELTKSIENQLQTLLKLFADRGKACKDGMEIVKRLYVFWVDLRAAHQENQDKEQRRILRVTRRTTVGHQTARQSIPPRELTGKQVPFSARSESSKTDEFIVKSQSASHYKQPLTQEPLTLASSSPCNRFGTPRDMKGARASITSCPYSTDANGSFDPSVHADYSSRSVVHPTLRRSRSRSREESTSTASQETLQQVQDARLLPSHMTRREERDETTTALDHHHHRVPKLDMGKLKSLSVLSSPPHDARETESLQQVSILLGYEGGKSFERFHQRQGSSERMAPRNRVPKEKGTKMLPPSSQLHTANLSGRDMSASTIQGVSDHLGTTDHRRAITVASNSAPLRLQVNRQEGRLHKSHSTGSNQRQECTIPQEFTQLQHRTSSPTHSPWQTRQVSPDPHQELACSSNPHLRRQVPKPTPPTQVRRLRKPSTSDRPTGTEDARLAAVRDVKCDEENRRGSKRQSAVDPLMRESRHHAEAETHQHLSASESCASRQHQVHHPQSGPKFFNLSFLKKNPK